MEVDLVQQEEQFETHTMERNTVLINRLYGTVQTVTSFDSFKLFGQKFHITISTENENLFTVTHQETGYCIDVDKKTIGEAKIAGIQFLKDKGKEKVTKAIRKVKWHLWKQKNIPKKSELKRWFMLFFYILIGLFAVVGSIVIGLYFGGNVQIAF